MENLIGWKTIETFAIVKGCETCYDRLDCVESNKQICIPNSYSKYNSNQREQNEKATH